MTGKVGPVARALGFAGLLPQAAAVVAVGYAKSQGYGLIGFELPILIGYPLIILSFLGGMWWGFAMRRTRGQGRLAVIAVVPSLASLALISLPIVGSLLNGMPHFGWSLVAIGVAVLLTLFVDRHLLVTGEAPDGWMRLRVPLSVGLGGLTILAGVLIGGPVSRF